MSKKVCKQIHFIVEQYVKINAISGSLSKLNLPPLWHLFLLDSVLAKVQLSLIDETETNTADESGVTVSSAQYIQELLPHVIRLTEAILHCTR